MDDNEIIDRFLERSESAITALGDKYSRYCRTIAVNILGDNEDAEEVLNDTYYRVWNSIPPERPYNLRAYTGKITRNLSIDRYNRVNAEKRGGGRIDAILSELDECIADKKNTLENLVESKVITAAINSFLVGQSIEIRCVFIRRYWRAASIEEIAEDFGMSVGKVKTMLFRTRNKLRKHLESEGIHL